MTKLEGNFTTIKNEVIKDKRLNVYDKAVYMVLSMYADNKTGECYPSQSLICELTGAGRSSVIKAIKHLEKLGYITVNKKQKGVKTLNTYKLMDVSEKVKTELAKQHDLTVDSLKKQTVKKQVPGTPDGPHQVCQTDPNNTNNNNTNKNTLFNKLNKEQSSGKKQKTKKSSHKEIALEKIKNAKAKSIPWSDVTFRDYTYYFMKQHETILGEPLTFDRYSSVSIIREDLIKRFELPLDKVCAYIDLMLENYKDSPSATQYPKLTFNMVQKNNRLIKQLVETSQNTIQPVEREFKVNDFTVDTSQKDYAEREVF